MKLRLFFCAISLIFILKSVLYAQSISDIGRYQLFQGTYRTYDLKNQEATTSTGIFLIDTKTGTVKRYLNKIDEDGKYIETWVPTEVQQEKK